MPNIQPPNSNSTDMENGWTQRKVDAPRTLPPSVLRPWSPLNYGGWSGLRR